VDGFHRGAPLVDKSTMMAYQSSSVETTIESAPAVLLGQSDCLEVQYTPFAWRSGHAKRLSTVPINLHILVRTVVIICLIPYLPTSRHIFES
jgi:hypothetical protein